MALIFLSIQLTKLNSMFPFIFTDSLLPPFHLVDALSNSSVNIILLGEIIFPSSYCSTQVELEHILELALAFQDLF